MRLKVRLTLTEALTSLALGKALTSSKLKVALSDGSLGLTREEVFKLTDVAVSSLCEAGFSGQVICWGKRGVTEHLDVSTSSLKFEQLSKSDFINFRRYLLGSDNLLHSNEIADDSSNAAGNGTPPEFTTAFAAFNVADCIRDVEVERVTFEQFRKTWGTKFQKSFTVGERDRWIVRCPENNVDNAYRLYKLHPRWDGTKQDAFRAQWRKLRIPMIGRRPSRP